jgi:4-amino-4-deoxy-L-arabinose transferase-like glycosyltransferase
VYSTPGSRLDDSQITQFQRLRLKWEDPSFRLEAIALGLVILMASALRVIWLDTIPGNITADEADNLSTVIRVQVTGEPGLFGLDWKPQPAMSTYIFAGFMAIFGDDIFGMRMASALFSTLALFPFYALARRVVRPVSALGGTALLATGLWYLNFSRSGWENVHVAFYALVAAWALTVALERRTLRWFALAGLFAALGLYGYFAGRLIIVALCAYLPVALWASRGYRRTVLAGYAVLVLVAVVLFLPQVPAVTDDRELFNRRTDVVNVFEQPRPYMGRESNVDILRLQIERNLRGFFLFDGDMFVHGRYGPVGQTLLDPVTGFLMLSGMAIGAFRWRSTALWWAMLLVPLALTQIPTSLTPDGARAVIAAPFMYLFVTLALDAFIDIGRHRDRVRVAGAMAFCVMLIAVMNALNYFEWAQSEETLEARQPAVELADYDLWRQTLVSSFQDGQPGFHLGDWEEMLDDIREQEQVKQ